MGEGARIADLLRKEAEERSDSTSKERRAALLQVLRRELDGHPTRSLGRTLAELRECFAPAGDDSEAAGLWEWIAQIEPRPAEPARRPAYEPQAHPPAPTAPAPRAAPAPASTPAGGGALEKVARATLGQYLPAGVPIDEEMQERLVSALDAIFGLLEMYEEQGRLLSAEIRKGTMLAGRSGGTIADLKRGDRLRKIIARAVVEGGDLEEVKKRLKSFGTTAVLVYGAHHASVRRATASIRQLIDPQALQKEHGKAAWEAYRRLYHNELHDLDPSFQAQFVDEPFIQEYFKEFDKL